LVIAKKNPMKKLFARKTASWNLIKKRIKVITAFKVIVPTKTIFLKKLMYYLACYMTLGPFI